MEQYFKHAKQKQKLSSLTLRLGGSYILLSILKYAS